MDKANVAPSMGSYRDLTPIKKWCTAVLPCVYDDTLSSYELMCKVIEYVNTMVSNGEVVQDNVQKLYDAFVELQSWVNENVNEEVFGEFVDAYFSSNEGVRKAIEDVAKPVVEDEVDNYIASVTDFQVANTAYMAPNGYVGKPGFRRIVEEDLPSGYPIDDLVTDNPYRPLSARQGKILSEGKAPSGYGVGTIATEILDANTAIENGWYKLTSVNTSEAHIPFHYVVIHVTAYSDRYIIQNLYRTDVSGTHMQRVLYDGTWGEWVNVSPSAFAPSGYGLGATNGVLITDGNDATRGGDYFWGDASTNLPFSYGYMRVVVRVNGSLVQTAYSVLRIGCVAQRQRVENTWSEWEWVNPPMLLDVEYRTTERWNDNPVYTKIFGVGGMPNNATKIFTHNIQGITQVLRCYGQDVTNHETIPMWYDNVHTHVYATPTEVYIYASSDRTANTAIVQMWYIKD